MENFIKNKCEILTFSEVNLDICSRLCMVEADFLTLQDHAKNFLHPQEFSILREMISEKRRHSYLLGRYAAKQALIQDSESIGPTHIFIKAGSFQQPVIYHLQAQEKMQVSISHCGERAVALAFPETHPMGIDLEHSNKAYNAVIERQLTPQEKNLLKTITHFNDTPETYYMILWTLKEALSKVLRTGLTAHFDIYEIMALQWEKDSWISRFKHFPQYQGHTFFIGDVVCSLIYPKSLCLTTSNFVKSITECFFP
jgi:4'-phosphopantetheinyl transferase